MQIKHLQHDSRGIQCVNCGQCFEVSRWALMNPEVLIEWKEGLAARHTCRQAKPIQPWARVWQMPTGQRAEAYFSREVRRLLPALVQ